MAQHDNLQNPRAASRVADSARAKRIARLVSEIKTALRDKPHLRARLRAMLEGKIPTEVATMPDTVRSFRLPDALWRQIDALVEALQNDPELALHGQVTHSTVIRVALARGLADLADKHGVNPAPPARPEKPEGKGKRR